MAEPVRPRPDGRNESDNERHDRNWTELLQELRVIQTGTQILTGFLLTLAFQQRFATLDGTQVAIYLVLVILSAVATALALAPVALHRALFTRRAKGPLVRIAAVIMKATLVAVGVTMVGTTLLAFDVVAGQAAGLIAGAAVLVLVGAGWLVMPLIVRAMHPHDR